MARRKTSPIDLLRPILAIVGRPNVGKSTLFNRLAGQRLALVDDQPGVTRDRLVADGNIVGLPCTIIDTPGYEDAKGAPLAKRLLAQTDAAIAGADVVLLVLDGAAGVTPSDARFAQHVRRSGKPVLLLANKCETKASQLAMNEAARLGFGTPIAISAAHGLGLDDIFEALQPHLPEEEAPTAEVPEVSDDTLHIAIVGRPNVGKSTLVNALIGEDRQLTGPEAGLTRDAVALPLKMGERTLMLVDTAGLRRKSRIDERLEKMSTSQSINAIRMAEVVLLVLDASIGLEHQDLTIAQHVVEEGRALVVVANKWDLVKERDKFLTELHNKLGYALAQLPEVAVVPLSAATGARLDKLWPAVFTAYENWNKRLPTPQLNRWLNHKLQKHAPPAVRGRRLRLRYVTQTKTRPPTFVLFVSVAGALPDSYLRYLSNGLREDFGLSGTPIRWVTKTSENPYADKD